MEPRMRRAQGLYHLRYRVPQHINCSTIYPRLSPDGSELIVIGHDHGLLVLWRGNAKAPSSGTAAHRHHGADEDAMAIDEPAESDKNASTPPSYAPIHHIAEIPLRTAVRHIACLPLPRTPLQDALIQPDLLRHNAVVALACGDNSIRALAFPLSPSWSLGHHMVQSITQAVDTNNATDIQMCIVSRFPGLNNLPTAISMGLVSSRLSQEDTKEENEVDVESWELLIVHHSHHLSGKIYIDRVPIAETGEAFHDALPPSTLRTIHLSNPASSLDVMIATSHNENKAIKVLATFEAAHIRIYEQSLENEANGRWTTALSLGLKSSHGAENWRASFRDAKWALGGNAVVALTRSGEWLLYDTSSKVLGSHHTSAIPLRPCLSGRLGSSTNNKSSAFVTPMEGTSKLAPMTPGTRQSKQATLFHGPSTLTTPAKNGGINVILRKMASSRAQDQETIVIWSGDAAIIISDFGTYWGNRNSQGKDPFLGGVGAHARTLPTTLLDGELRTAVTVFAPTTATVSKFRAEHVDTLITGQLSFAIVAAPVTPLLDARPSAVHGRSSPPDSALLDTGDLDVAGIDRMLDFIENHTASQRKGSQRIHTRET